MYLRRTLMFEYFEGNKIWYKENKQKTKVTLRAVSNIVCWASDVDSKMIQKKQNFFFPSPQCMLLSNLLNGTEGDI